jgi:hypothetical protein
VYGVTDLAALLKEEADVELDIQRAFDKLGDLLTKPAINEVAAQRREQALLGQQQEIARMQRVQAQIGSEITAAVAEAAPASSDPRDGYALDDPKRLAFESGHW